MQDPNAFVVNPPFQNALAADAVYYQGENAPVRNIDRTIGHDVDETLTTSLANLEKLGERNIFSFNACSSKVDQRGRCCTCIGSANSSNFKILLQNVSGELRGGTDLAVMGPSGAGKSTLLNLLTLVPSNAKSEGDIKLNGHLLTEKLFRRYCAYVPQEDNLWAFMTCRETIEFATDFYLGLPKQEKEQYINRLVADLGLDSCQHTRCGNQFIQGLSGGQKRRLSLAIVLVKQPAVLFLDELTSGLDSFAAAEIMTVVRRVARSTGIVVICTIHQPSTRVYNEFDSAMLLSGGRVAYSGPARSAVEYFVELTGRELPIDLSPCEFMLEAINSDFGGPEKKEQVEKVLEAWADRPVAAIAGQKMPLPSGGSRETPLVKQVWIHLRRQALLCYRDPTLYLSRVVMFMICSIFFAWVYVKSRDRNQEQVTNRMFLAVWLIGVPTSMGAIAVFALNIEFYAIRREIKNGSFSPWSYIVSNALFQVPIMFILALSILCVAAYGIANFQAARFGEMLVLFALTLWCFELIAQALSVAFANPLLGILTFISVWFASFLFCGFFLPEDDIPWPLKVFLYIMPTRWYMASIVKTEFLGTEFDGARLVENPMPGEAGFVCDDPTIYTCFGRTGKQVLESMAKIFPLFEPSDTLARDCLVVFAIGVVYKILFIVIFLYRTANASRNLPPEKVEAAQELPHEET